MNTTQKPTITSQHNVSAKALRLLAAHDEVAPQAPPEPKPETASYEFRSAN